MGSIKTNALQIIQLIYDLQSQLNFTKIISQIALGKGGTLSEVKGFQFVGLNIIKPWEFQEE